MKPKSGVEKTFLSINEFAAFLGRPDKTVRRWIADGRVRTKDRRKVKNTIRRIAVVEAERVKRLILSGEWGVE